MPTVRFICLANSKKIGGRCIAGIRVDGGGWVRPVGPSSTGELYSRHYILQDGTEPQLLDLIEVDLEKHAPEPHQPENYVISGGSWTLIERPAPRKYLRLLKSYVVKGPELFGNCSDRMASEVFDENPADCSLVLVQPEDLRFCITDNIRGRRQTRALFKIGRQHYDLVITDITWKSRINQLENGIYTLKESGLEGNENIILTISLGEPAHFDGCCYKLAAAVILLPT